MKKALLIIVMLGLLTGSLLAQTTKTGRVPSGPNLPASCVVGDLFSKTTSPIKLHQCIAANTWDPVGSATASSVTPTFFDDFIGGLTTSGNVGDQGWTITTGGAGGINSIAGTIDRPGQIRLLTDTVASATGIKGLNDATLIGNQGNVTTDFAVKPGTETTTVIHRIGLASSQATGDPANGIFFRSTNGGNWFAVTRAASVETATDTTVAFASAFKRFETVMNAAGTSVDFKIDGTVRATHTANIPTAGLTPSLLVEATAAAQRTVEVDYYQLRASAIAGSHNILSTTHADSSSASVIRGDLIVGSITPLWARLAIGGAARVLRSDGTDPSWQQVALATDVSGVLPVVSGGTGAAPSADDQLLVADSISAATWRGVPNCTDTGGNHLNYTAATNAFSCGTTSGGGGTHNFLSTTHPDTTAGTVARGDIVTGQGATPTWSRLAKGTADQCLRMDGTATDILWSGCGTGTPGGSTGQAQFNSSGSFGGDAQRVYASSQTGADWCAKVAAADTQLGTASGFIVLTTAAGTTACAASLTIGAKHTLLIEGGTYTIGGATVSILMSSGSGISCMTAGEGTACVLKHTGATGTAILKAGAGTIGGILIENIEIDSDGGAGNTAKGVDTSNWFNSSMRNVHIVDFGIQHFCDNALGSGSYYNLWDHMFYQAGAGASGFIGVQFQNGCNQQVWLAPRFHRLGTAMKVGASGDTLLINSLRVYGASFESADTVFIDIIRSINFVCQSCRFEGLPTATGVQVAADPNNAEIVLEDSYFQSVTTEYTGPIILKGTYKTQLMGLSTSAAPNLAPNPRLEIWGTTAATGSTSGWTSAAGTNWNTGTNLTRESTVQCGSSTQCTQNSGSFSAKFGDGAAVDKGMAWAQAISVDPKRIYTISYWWGATATSIGVRPMFRLKNSSGTTITTGTIVANTSSGTDPMGGWTNATLGYSASFDAHILSSNQTPSSANVLQRFNVVMLAFPSGTASIQFGIQILSGVGFGFLDDQSFGEGEASWRPTNTAQLVAGGFATLGTAAIASGACAAVVTVSATGISTADAIAWSFNADPNAVTGYGAGTGGALSVWAFPTVDNVNFRVCNLNGASITPGAMTVNWRVTR